MALKEHVDFDTYNQTLRDSVNAYYTHAMNDPTMTQEEAIQSTAQMSEEYLTAVDDFQANAALNDSVDMNDPSVDVGSIDGGGGGGIESDDGLE